MSSTYCCLVGFLKIESNYGPPRSLKNLRGLLHLQELKVAPGGHKNHSGYHLILTSPNSFPTPLSGAVVIPEFLFRPHGTLVPPCFLPKAPFLPFFSGCPPLELVISVGEFHFCLHFYAFSYPLHISQDVRKAL